MLNAYSGQLKEQSDEINTLKSENDRLKSEIDSLHKKVRRRNDVNTMGGNIQIGQVNRDMEMLAKPGVDPYHNPDAEFEFKQQDLMLQITKLKSQLQAVSPTSDEEPERTQSKRSDFNILSSIIENESPEISDKLQNLLDNSAKTQQRLLFADKNDQLWEIIKMDDWDVDASSTMVEV